MVIRKNFKEIQGLALTIKESPTITDYLVLVRKDNNREVAFIKKDDIFCVNGNHFRFD